MGWIASIQNPYVEALQNVTAFEDRVFVEMFKVKWGCMVVPDPIWLVLI
jgi:hypothetical protein